MNPDKFKEILAARKLRKQRAQQFETSVPALHYWAHEHWRLIKFYLNNTEEALLLHEVGLPFCTRYIDFFEYFAPVERDPLQDRYCAHTEFVCCLRCDAWNCYEKPQPRLFVPDCNWCVSPDQWWFDQPTYMAEFLDLNRFLWYYWPIEVRKLTTVLIRQEIFNDYSDSDTINIKFSQCNGSRRIAESS